PGSAGTWARRELAGRGLPGRADATGVALPGLTMPIGAESAAARRDSAAVSSLPSAGALMGAEKEAIAMRGDGGDRKALRGLGWPEALSAELRAPVWSRNWRPGSSDLTAVAVT